MPPVLAYVLVCGGGSPRWWDPWRDFVLLLRVSVQKGPLTAMQIRLTVVDPLGPPSEPWARTASCDVVVTAPAGDGAGHGRLGPGVGGRG